MAYKISTKLRTFMAGSGSLKRALTGGVLRLYTGAQPASADSAMPGTLLAELTLGGAARTAEVLSRGSVTLTGGASGSVDQIAVNSVNLLAASVPFNTSLAQTAADVVEAINANETNPDYFAIASGAKIIIQAQPLTGTGPNGYTVVSTVTTITKTDVNMGTEAAGVAQANGLTWGAAVDGVLSMSGTWSGLGLAVGTAGCARFTGSIADANGDDSATKAQVRMDMSVGTSGADIILANTAITINAPVALGSFTLTVPAS